MVITGQYSLEWSIENFKWFCVFCGGLIDIFGQILLKKQTFLELIRWLTATSVHWGVPRQNMPSVHKLQDFDEKSLNDHFRWEKWLVPKQAMHCVTHLIHKVC